MRDRMRSWLPWQVSAVSLQLAGKVEQVFGRDVDRHTGAALAGARAMLVRPRHVGSTQAAAGRRLQVVAVRRYHHAVAGSEVERRTCRQVDTRLRLVVA